MGWAARANGSKETAQRMRIENKLALERFKEREQRQEQEKRDTRAQFQPVVLSPLMMQGLLAGAVAGIKHRNR